MTDRPERPTVYAREGGRWLVELRVGAIRELFDRLDPSPVPGKCLDLEAEEYITESVEDIGRHEPISIVVHVPEDGVDPGAVGSAMRHHFTYRSEQASRQLRRLVVQGALSLAIGVTFLVACLSVRHFATLPEILAEGLLIIGWVAMWRPLDMILYEWWPIWRRRAHLTVVAGLPVAVRRVDSGRSKASSPGG